MYNEVWWIADPVNLIVTSDAQKGLNIIIIDTSYQSPLTPAMAGKLVHAILVWTTNSANSTEVFTTSGDVSHGRVVTYKSLTCNSDVN